LVLGNDRSTPVVEHSTTKTPVGYGAGPVSVPLTRGRPLTEAPTEPVPDRVVMAPPPPARDRNAYDRLGLKHWPRGHRVLVCSLTGGTGRTTVAAQLAATLAGLPFAHIWPPALLVDGTGRRHLHPSVGTGDRSDNQWDEKLSGLVPVGTPLRLQTTLSGIALLQPTRADRLVRRRQLQTTVATVQDRFAPVIIDAPCGLPSNSLWTRGVPAGFSVVLVVRPDEYSLNDAAQALVWMHDQHQVRKQQVTVVVNRGAGPPSGRTRSAAAALAVRCHGLHQLPVDPRLGPSPIPPTARPVPARLRLRLAQICLNIWHTSQTPTHRPDPHRVDHPQENP
jgi:Mrp family chromosome partitioning ATPase